MDENRKNYRDIVLKMLKGAFEDDQDGLKLLLYLINTACFFSPSIMLLYILDSNLVFNPNWSTILIMIMISSSLYSLLRYTTLIAHVRYDKNNKEFVPKANLNTINYNGYICNMMGLTAAILFITNVIIAFTKASINKRLDIILYIFASLSVVIFWGLKRIYYEYLSNKNNK